MKLLFFGYLPTTTTRNIKIKIKNPLLNDPQGDHLKVVFYFDFNRPRRRRTTVADGRQSEAKIIIVHL